MVSSQNQPENHPIYALDTNFGSAIFYNEGLAENEDRKDKLAENSELKGF